MKITKKRPIKGNTDPINEAIIIQELAPPWQPCKYDDTIQLISAAVESLAEIAKDDELAKDSIANLGVVMLDLKGGC